MQDKSDDLLPYRTARGTLYILAATIISNTFASIFFIFIARFLPSISDLGLINGLQVLINMAVIVSGLGLSGAATRFMSYYYGSERQDIAEQVGVVILKIGLLSSFTVSFLLYLSAPYIAITLFHDSLYTNLIKLGSVDIFFVGIASFLVSILYSLQEFKKISFALMSGSLLKIVAAFVLLIYGMSVEGIVIGYIIGDTAYVAILIYILKPQMYRNFSHKLLRPLFAYALPLFGGSILTFLSTNIDYYLILILSDLSTAGIYSPAILLATILFLILTTLEQTLLPYFSRLYGKYGIPSLKNISIFASRYIFLILFPLGFIMLASSPVIITKIFGERYFESIYPAMIVIVAITLTSSGIIFNNILKSAGHTNIFMISTSIAVLIQLLISAVTIPSVGAVGAALARSFAYIVMLILPAYKLKRISGIYYDVKALQYGLVGSMITASVVFILGLYLSNPYYLPLILFIGCMSYFMYLRFTGAMNAKDFEIINDILLGKLKLPLALLAKIVLR